MSKSTTKQRAQVKCKINARKIAENSTNNAHKMMKKQTNEWTERERERETELAIKIN